MRLIQAGPRDAKIVLCGEAPGATEQASGVPFSGATGELLNKMLGKVGIRRDACFVTNIVHQQPPKNNFDWFIRTNDGQKHLLLGVLQLKRDLEEIRPNLVIAFGANPLKYLTKKVGIEKWRGSILESTIVSGTKVVATYHPAYCFRIWDFHAVIEFDLLRCAEEAGFPEIRLPQRDMILNPPRETRRPLLEELSKAEWLGIDIECFEVPGSGWRLACVGFSDKADRAVVIPIETPGDKEDVRFLCGSPAKKVLQNGTFDVTVLKSHNIEVTNFVWDTMLAHHSIYPECASSADEMAALAGKKRTVSPLQKGLAFQASIYTKEPFYKDDGKVWQETNDLQMFWLYNAKDVAVTREIRDVQAKELAQFGTEQVFQDAMDLVEPLMAATERGILVDKEVHAKLMKQYESEASRLQDFVDKAAGGPLNVKSPKQVTELLYDVLGLPPKYKKRGSGTSTITADKDAIVELAAKHKHPVLLSILEIRKRRDLIERYLNTAFDADGVMRCSFDITGTRSGRLSSRRSIHGSGTNLQNVPPQIRRMFVARPGMTFVYCDYSQAEARVVAYLARCEGLIELFNDPTRDIHTENAARIFNKKPQDVDKKIERYLAKRVVHACNYGMQDKRLTQVVNEDSALTGVRIENRESAMLIEKYFMLYPEIKENFWREVERELAYSRTLTTPFGRKRQFFGRWDEKLLREAYSFIPQSTVGDLTRRAVVRCHREISRAHLLLTVHDSILMECKDSEVEEVSKEMSNCMEIPITIGPYTFTIPTDSKNGKNWGDHADDNPDGLK